MASKRCGWTFLLLENVHAKHAQRGNAGYVRGMSVVPGVFHAIIMLPTHGADGDAGKVRGEVRMGKWGCVQQICASMCGYLRIRAGMCGYVQGLCEVFAGTCGYMRVCAVMCRYARGMCACAGMCGWCQYIRGWHLWVISASNAIFRLYLVNGQQTKLMDTSIRCFIEFRGTL